MQKWCGRRIRKSNLICISISALNNKLNICGIPPPPPPPPRQLTPEWEKEHLEDLEVDGSNLSLVQLYLNSNENKSYSVMLEYIFSYTKINTNT